MSLSMYQASVPAFLQTLNNFSAILDKAEAYAGNHKIDPEVLLNYRLAPDMLPFVRQIQIAADLAKGAAARLAGVEVPKHDDTENYCRKLETVEAFHYEAALETMDFKYPFPDWLKDMVTVRENAILQLDTDFGLVRVKPGQWVVKDSRGNLHILDPEEFHRRFEAASD